MCVSTINIFNPAKSISRHFFDRLILSVPCGQCCECQQRKANEWYYRASVEWFDCVRNGGFVLFDTLSYSDDSLPHYSDFLDDVEKSKLPAYLDFPCFSHRDIRLFRESLHNKLVRAGYDVNSSNFRFFLSSEYGTSDEYIDWRGNVRFGTHRPHYHLLYYCSVPGLTNLELSRFISDTWEKGRTDGVKYKGVRYVNEETTFVKGNAASIAVSRYVTKYVQKDCEFREKIDARINALVMYYACRNNTWFEPEQYYDPSSLDITCDSLRCATSDNGTVIEHIDYDSVDSYLRSESGKKMRRDIVRLVDQFHRQSTGFGASAIAGFDMNDIMETGTLKVLDQKKVVLVLPLPLYYKRKLFYKQIVVDGVKTWQPTELGDLYNQKCQVRTVSLIANRYRGAALECGKYSDVDFDDLAYYMVYRKGRYHGWILHQSSPYTRSLYDDNYYSYTTSADVVHFHDRFVTTCNLGNNTIGYETAAYERIPLSRFIQEHVYSNQFYDDVIDDLQSVMFDHAVKRQAAYEEEQRLRKLYKHYK